MSFLEREISRTEVAEPFGIPLVSFRNDDGTVMDATGGANKLSLNIGGFGTGTLEIVGELASGVTKTDDMMVSFVVPINAQTTAFSALPDNGSKAISIKIQHKTDPIAATTSSMDVEVYLSDENGGVVGSDLVTTGPITNNSTTWIEQEFTITPTNVEPGDELSIHIRTIVNDATGANNAQAHIGKVTMNIAAKL